jgi:hypothetical protein
MLALLVRVEHYLSTFVRWFIAFEALQAVLSLLGLLFIGEHVAALFGFAMELHSPIALHAIDTASHLARETHASR